MKNLLYSIKFATYLIVIMMSVETTAQTKLPFYEQLAFDFYQNTVLDSFPVKKKITVYKYTSDLNQFGYSYNVPNCIGNFKNDKQFSVLKAYAENQIDFDNAFFELNTNLINKKQFRIKEKLKGPYPKLFISQPIVYELNENRVFINIFLVESELVNINYCLEFDPDGKIINWCHTKNISYIEN